MAIPTQRKTCLGGCRGSVLLMVIGALIVLSIVGAAVSRLTGSSGWTEIQENRLDGAYYAAHSGLQYLKYAEQNTNSSYTDINDYVAKINAGSPYSFSSTGERFEVSVSAVSGSTNEYTIDSIVGMVQPVSGGGKQSNFVLSGYSLPNGGVRTLTLAETPPSETAKKFSELVFFSKGTTSIDTSGAIYGGVYGEVVVFNGGSNVYGSVKQSSTTTALTLQGRYIGGTGETVCSNSSVKIAGNVQVVGNIYSKIGGVNVDNGDVVGNIYSAGDVVLSSGSTVSGNIYALGSVNIKNGTVTGDVYATGTVTLSSGSKVNGDINTQTNVELKNGGVTGAVHYKTAFIYCGSCTYGSQDKFPVYPNYVFACDMDYVLPAHEVKVATSPFILDWSAPYTGEATITAKASIDDYYAYTSFSTAHGTKLCLDLSNGGYITMFISGKVTLNSTALYVRTSTSTNCFDSANLVDNIDETFSSYASRVYVDSSGTDTITFNSGASWFGTLYAAGNVEFSRSNAVIGAYYSSNGSTIRNGGGSSKLVPADYVLKHW